MGLPEKKFQTEQNQGMNQGGLVLSEEARNDANSFWQTQKGISSADGSNTSIYMKRMRVMIGSLGGIILLLVGALVFVALNSDVQLGAAVAPLAQTSMVKVIVARENISVGRKIEPAFLEVKELDSSHVPDSTLLESDIPRIIDKYAARLIPAGGPIQADAVTRDSIDEPAFKIPSGYRAVTLDVGGRTGGEGFVRAGAHVDVLWFYAAEDKQKVTTIVSGARVLSVNANTGKVIDSATLLVTQKESHVIELSRNLGSLSLSLVGEEESSVDSVQESQVVTIKDILKEEDKPEPVNGRIEIRDPVTGERSTFVLTNNRLKMAGEREKDSFTSLMDTAKASQEKEIASPDSQK